jgi:hypothetical protein
MAAMQGVVSTCESVAGSVPVAPQPGDNAARSTQATTPLRIKPVKQRRIDFLSIAFDHRIDRSKRSAARTTPDFGPITLRILLLDCLTTLTDGQGFGA